jgi:hypothetical protein
MKVVCVIADVVASRHVSDRTALQDQLAATLHAINQNRHGLLSPYTITLGDEFQAVLQSADGIFADLALMQSQVHPTAVRFSIGGGPLATPVNNVSAIGMDGPAFYAARSGIEHLKKTRERLRVSIPGAAAEWIDPVLSFISHAQAKWPASRFVILHHLLTGKRVSEIQPEVRLTPAAVYKSTNAGGLREMVRILKAVEHAIDVALAQA